MALDGIFLYHLKNEIADLALDSRIDKIYQPSGDELVFALRSREGMKRLLISCNADSARIHFTDYPPENPPVAPMFCQLLRKRISGARIVAVEQDNLERTLTIKLSATDDLGDKCTYFLITEIMGRYSNIIFTDGDGKIIDSVKRVDESKSHIRRVMPGEQYKAPPAQDKLNIFECSALKISGAMSKCGGGIYKSAMQVIKGVSPIICRELENGLTVEGLKYAAENPSPCAVITDKPKDFAFTEIHQYGSLATLKKFDTFSSLLDYFFFERVRLMRVKARSSDLFKRITTLHERAVRKAENRRRELEDCRDKELYRLYGDLINANLYRLEKGAAYYDVENFYDGGKTVRIPANVMLTPAQNAAEYFKEYRKKKNAEQRLSGFIADAESEAQYFVTVLDELSRAETDAEITAVREELSLGGYVGRASNGKKAKAKRQKQLEPLRFKTRDGFNVLVGRNNVMNDRLTMKTAKNYDTWFHTQDCPGCHLICETSGSEITDAAVHDCALIAAYFSKARESSNVPVDYTLVKNIRKPNGARPGFVIYDNYKTEYVTPDKEEVERLKDV